MENSYAARSRYMGCRRAFELRGRNFDRSRQYEGARFSMEDGYHGMLRILNKMPEVTAVFAMSDVMSLVAGHIKGHHPHFAELFQRFIDGRTVLVQPEPCSVLTHVFPPSLIPMQTKKRKYRTKSADLRFEKHLNAPPKTPGRNTRVQRPLRMIQKRRDYESLYSNSAFTALY